jgi:tRNA 2-thiocytidine biosynthesis protein TtcA
MTKTKLPKTVNNLRKKMGEVLYKQQLVAPDDKILVGLSGGKDSLVLIDLLADQRKHIPFPFELVPIHITANNIGYQTDLPYLKSFCEERDIAFHQRNIEIEDTENNNKNICFVCSWNRRKAMFSAAKELSCNKLALGHHMDDALETMLMNMIFHASLSSLPYSLSMFEGELQVIRPLLSFTEEYVKAYADKMHFPEELKTCPHGTNSSRKEMKELVDYMGKHNKNVRKNMFRAMGNQYPEYLPKHIR